MNCYKIIEVRTVEYFVPVEEKVFMVAWEENVNLISKYQKCFGDIEN